MSKPATRPVKRLTLKRLRIISNLATIYAVGMDEDEVWSSRKERASAWDAIEALDASVRAKKKKARKPTSQA
jgi:hypothetical protein